MTTTDKNHEAAPIDAISKLLEEAMSRAVANGADSRSMPDDYVAIAHFTCYPEQYGYAVPRQHMPSDPTREWLLGDALAACLKIIAENRKRIGYEAGSPNDKTVRAARKLLEERT